MSERLNIPAFVRDYCAGVKDRELLARYGLSAKQIGQLVKTLINKGTITKEQYLNRNRVIAELNAREEKDFLKSLSHCPVCGHMHPTPFTHCPACGSHVSRHKDKETQAGLTQSTWVLNGDKSLAPERGGGGTEIASSEERVETPADAGQVKRPAAVVPEQARPPLRVVPREDRPTEEVPAAILRMIGEPLEHVSLLPRFAERFQSEDYRISGLLGNGKRSAALKASGGEGENIAITVKVFHAEAAQPAGTDEVMEKLFEYQSAMDDPNIRRMIGRASVTEKRVLLYEYLPLNLEEVVQREPEGLPVDLLIHLISQLLNGVGYSHLHRGKHGIPTRLPHLSLKLSNILLDEDMNVLKLDDCGMTRSLMEVRGYKKHLWQEPGADPGSLAPETFVSDIKFLNGLLVDIYALGVVLYRIATGKTPFSGATVDEYRFSHLKKYAVPPRVHRYDIPLWLDEMIMRCLEKEPDQRWRSATQMELAIGKGVVR